MFVTAMKAQVKWAWGDIKVDTAVQNSVIKKNMGNMHIVLLELVAFDGSYPSKTIFASNFAGEKLLYFPP